MASPAVADGIVVTAGSDGQIRGLRASDGSPLWRLSAAAGLGASPAIQRGRVYIPTLGGHLLALRLGDGTTLWDRPLGGQNYGSPALSGGSLILATGFPTQKMVRVDAASGDLQWETAPGVVAGLANSSPAIEGRQVVFGMNNGRYQSLDLATGAPSWSVDTQGLVNLSSPLLVGRVAYFVPGGRTAAIHAVDRDTGRPLGGWPITIGDPAPPTAGLVSVRHAVSSPTRAGRLVVFQVRFEYAIPASDGTAAVDHLLREYAVAVDPARAAIAWRHFLGARVATNVNQIPELGLCPTPAVFATASGPALAAASSLLPILRVLDGASGAELWASSLAAPTRSSPVVANGQLLVGTDNGFLEAFASQANHAPAAPASGFVPGGGSSLDGAAPVLRWSAAEDLDGTPPTYQVRVDSDGEILESWKVELTTGPGQNVVTLPTGLLRPGDAYVYAVRSRDRSGAQSGWSQLQSFTAALTPSIEVEGATYHSLADALAAAPAGATVHVGPGLLHLGATLALTPGRSLTGAGPHDTVLDAAGLAVAIEIGAPGGPSERAGRAGAPCRLQGLTVAGGWVGVKVAAGEGHRLQNLVVRDTVRAGIEVEAGGGAEIVNATIVRNGTGAASGGTLSVRNSIITDNEIGLSRRGEGMLSSRYDDLFGNRTVNYEGLAPGPGDISAPVIFAGDPGHDCRLAVLQATSDRGDPADDYSQEPAPNGGRVNMGAFGNTPLAEPSAGGVTWRDQVSNMAATGCSVGGHGELPIGGSLLSLLGGLTIAKRRSRRPPLRRRRRVRWLIFKALVLASLLSSPAHAVTRVQAAAAGNKSDTTVKTDWPSGTTSGNLLVAVVAVRGGSGTTITPPSGKGWTLAARADNGTSISTAIYYSANASSQSGTSTWTLAPSTHATLSLIEYGGASPAAVLDRTATATGSSATASTGTTAATAQASEVAVAAFSIADTQTFSGESNGFGEIGGDVASTTSSPSTRNTTAVADRSLSVTGAQASVAMLSGDGADWAGAVATFKTAIRYWIGNGSEFGGRTNWSLSSGGASNTGAPDSSSIVVFDGGTTTSCTVSTTVSLDALQIGAGYTGTVTIDPAHGSLATAHDVTVAGGALHGVVTVGGALTMSGGTWDPSGGSMSVAGAAQVNGGTFEVGTGTQTMTAGLTVGPAGTLDLTGASGRLLVGAGAGLTVNGTLTTSGSGSTVPRIDWVSGNYPFTVGSTATVNVSGLRIDHTDASGMKVTNANFQSLQNVQFRNNAGGSGSTHLYITSNALELYAPGCYFDGTAAVGVKLVGNGSADGQTRANFEYRSAATNGDRAGESYDVDDDNSPRDGVGDNPASNGAVLQWMYSVMSDTAGAVQGFPTAAFDWNSFTWYGVYVAYRDTGGSGTSDKVYVRNMDGDAQYSFSIAQTDGDIIGTPRWDSLSEVTLGMDINGDGDSTDASVHVLYIPTTSGKIYKLIDSGSALAPPGASSVWATAFSDARVTSITSPLVSDGTNLYFGGVDNAAPPAARVFGVQIAAGAGERTLVKSIGAAGPITVAPAWKVFSGTTYLFLGSQAVSGQAYVYRMDVAPGASINAQCLDAKQDVNGSVRLIGNYAVAGDSGGRVHHIDAGSFAVGGFANTAGFPFRDTGTHTVAFLDAGGGAVLASPYTDTTTGYIYAGDKDGHLYALTGAGALLPGYPLRLTTSDRLDSSPIYSSGVIMIGSSGGQVYYVDQNNGSGAPALFHTLSFGAVGISSIAYNASKAEYMVATSGGQLFFIGKLGDPTP